MPVTTGSGSASGESFMPVHVCRSFFGAGFKAALIALFLGAMCLVVDVGCNDRLLNLVFRLSFTYITVGTFALGVCLLLALLLTFVWQGGRSCAGYRFALALEWILALVSIVVMVYTGLFLSSIRAVPLWATGWLPVLFTLSALSCGFALVIVAGQLSGSLSVFARSLSRLLPIDVIVLALELIAAFLVIVSSLRSVVSYDAFSSVPSLVVLLDSADNASMMAAASGAYSLMFGSNAGLFWIGFVLFGIVVPLVLSIVLRRNAITSSVLVAVYSLCVFVGGVALRFGIVLAGVSPAAFL